jgi:hypothetical protein
MSNEVPVKMDADTASKSFLNDLDRALYKYDEKKKAGAVVTLLYK